MRRIGSANGNAAIGAGNLSESGGCAASGRLASTGHSDIVRVSEPARLRFEGKIGLIGEACAMPTSLPMRHVRRANAPALGRDTALALCLLIGGLVLAVATLAIERALPNELILILAEYSRTMM
jgi:hypothetical protein